jgi:septal ring-binding cell division protein DamX
MEWMVYLVGLLVLGLVIYGIVKAITENSYAEMTEEEFEAEAKRSSNLGPAIMTVQKIFDPSHHVEYIQEENEREEADAAESGDRPVAGPVKHNPDYKIPD